MPVSVSMLVYGPPQTGGRSRAIHALAAVYSQRLWYYLLPLQNATQGLPAGVCLCVCLFVCLTHCVCVGVFVLVCVCVYICRTACMCVCVSAKCNTKIRSKCVLVSLSE